MYAVDASDIAKHATKIVECNHLEGKIEVIQCKGEKLNLSEKVDLIVSEWMGTLLLVSQTPAATHSCITIFMLIKQKI